MRKHGGFRKGGNLHHTATTSDLCHKCGKAGHFIRDCPMFKVETKEYQRPGGEKEKRRDLVPEKNARKALADYVMKKALAVWGDSSSESGELECPDDASMLAVQDDANIFDGPFTLKAKSDDEDDEEKVTLEDFKQNLNTYSVRRLRNLVVVLIDSVIDLTAEKDFMNNSLDILGKEKTVTTTHMSFVEEQLTVLEVENLELENQLSIMIEKSGKKKGEATSLQTELEVSLNTIETRLAIALERNYDPMKRDLVLLREELNTSLKWTRSSELLSNITRQSNYNKKRLGSLNINPPYNLHSKYVSVSDNLLCLHCRRNGFKRGKIGNTLFLMKREQE
ncbi:hypothetical protein KY289_018584 [Solanum tuberosum]|nr:hypothetical protein KY289_018584 [Solanum tuberosum]